LRKSDARFPRSCRLLDAAAFDRVFRQAARSRDELFTVLWRANGVGRARLGLAVSKKHVKRAVDRNRIKRIIRESFRHHQTTLLGLDLVVIGHRRLSEFGNHKVTESLARHWENIAAKIGP
jgi:ribonuclease P protein component